LDENCLYTDNHRILILTFEESAELAKKLSIQDLYNRLYTKAFQ